MGSVPVVHRPAANYGKRGARPGGRDQASIVAIARNQGDGGFPDSLVDAYLLQQFPGKTLDELDQMDWARYNRALRARYITDIEDTAKLYKSHKIQAKDVSATKWERIRQNDEMFYKYYGSAPEE